MTTNVPLPSFTDAGLAIPTEPQVLSGVFADMVAAFAASGKALNTELTTPQGQLAQSQAYMVTQLYAAMLQIINAVDPATSSGAFQDALGRIYYLTRKPATYATVAATLGGVPGATIPAGALARATDGSLWGTTAAAIIAPNGRATVTLQAQESGSGPVAGINGLTIYQQQSGWETITNAAPSTPGRDAESRQDFELRRSASVNIGGRGTAPAVRAAVANVEDVTDVYVYNNSSSSALSYGATNYPVPANSLVAVVAGGADADIAQAIHSKLDAGCGMATSGGVGTLVTETVVDSEGYAEPYPQYAVRFVRPLPVTVYMRVEVADLDTLPGSYVTLVQTAVADALTNGFYTADGTIAVSRARIGAQVVAAEYFAPILALGNITPVSIYVGFSPNPTSGAGVVMGIDQLPVTIATDITVVTVTV